MLSVCPLTSSIEPVNQFYDIGSSYIWQSPLHWALRLISMLSVCPLASSIEPVNQFSWYKNLSHLTVTPTLGFKFDFHAVCVLSLLLLSQLTNFHDIRISYILRSPLHWALSLISMLSVCPLASSIEPFNLFSWYKNHSRLTVTPTLGFKFDFHAVCVSSRFFYWASWPVFMI